MWGNYYTNTKCFPVEVPYYLPHRDEVSLNEIKIKFGQIHLLTDWPNKILRYF